MSRSTRKKSKYRPKGKNLISTHRINPQQWHLTEAETIEALQAQGCEVKQIKKIRPLQHQVCISYWDEQGGVCSGFFSSSSRSSALCRRGASG